MRARLKKTEYPEENGVELTNPTEWADLFTRAIRYKANAEIDLGDAESEISAPLAQFSIEPPREAGMRPLVRLAFYWDSENVRHGDFVRSICFDPSRRVNFHLRLPNAVIFFRGEWSELSRNKLIFEMHSNLFEVRNRKVARVAVKFPVLHPASEGVGADKIWLRAEAFDLSEDGVGLILKEAEFAQFPHVNEFVEGLTLRLEERTVMLTGYVRHASLVPQNQFPQKRFRVGIEFQELSEESRAVLRGFLGKKSGR